MPCFRLSATIDPERDAYNTLVLYISHYNTTEPYDISELARVCSGARNESYLVFYYDSEQDTYEALAFHVKHGIHLNKADRFDRNNFFYTIDSVARELCITQFKICCHANMGEMGETHVVGNVNELIHYFIPNTIYFIADNQACAEDARRYLLGDNTDLGYTLPPYYYITGDYFLESTIPATLKKPEEFDSWIDNPAYRTTPFKKSNALNVYVFNDITEVPIMDMVNRIHTALHEPSVVATYDADIEAYTVTQLVTRVGTSEKEEIQTRGYPIPGRNYPIPCPTEPLSLRHFTQFVQLIASHFYLRCDDGIRLCVPASLGDSTSSTITEPAHQLIQAIIPNTVHLVQCSASDKEDIRRYLRRQKTRAGYQIPEAVKDGNSFDISIIAQLAENSSNQRMLSIFNNPQPLPAVSDAGCFSYLTGMFRSCSTFFGCFSEHTTYITPSNRVLEARNPEITDRNPVKIKFANR